VERTLTASYLPEPTALARRHKRGGEMQDCDLCPVKSQCLWCCRFEHPEH
jgi:hypothetical protein